MTYLKEKSYQGYDPENTTKIHFFTCRTERDRKAGEKLGDWRLEEYAHVCNSGAMPDVCRSSCAVHQVVMGRYNPKAGCAACTEPFGNGQLFNHKVKVTRGVLEEECSAMLSDFFQKMRQEKKLREGKLFETR